MTHFRAKKCTVSLSERQFATLYLFHAYTGGGARPFYREKEPPFRRKRLTKATVSPIRSEPWVITGATFRVIGGSWVNLYGSLSGPPATQFVSHRKCVAWEEEIRHLTKPEVLKNP